jgi:tetratricopeptide (TPR) repeat protein
LANRFIFNPVRILLDAMWHLLAVIISTVLVGGLLVNVLISLLTIGTPGLADPRGWVAIRLLISHPSDSALGLAVALVFILCAFVGHRASHATVQSIPNSLVETYGVALVSTATPPSRLIPFYKHIYIPRLTKDTHSSADETARKVLHSVASRTDLRSTNGVYGICVYGRKMLGTSRLAWQALKSERELGKWTLVEWPTEPRQYGDLFDALRRQGSKVALWLENLPQYAGTQYEAIINSIPLDLADRQVPFLIIATCPDGADEKEARKAFSSLIEHLAPIRLADLTQAEARTLVSELTRAGESAYLDDRFDGTPGSIVLAVARMRDEVYPRLPTHAKMVLRAIKLLRSAGIREYPAPRVFATAQALFDPAGTDSDWTQALSALDRAGFLNLKLGNAGGLLTLIPVADVYLDLAVPDYGSADSPASADWPRLQESLERELDARALVRLGDAFRRKDTEAHAERCYRSALGTLTKEDAKGDWALAQFGLGSVLADRLDDVPDPQRDALLDEAEHALRESLKVISRESDPTIWGQACGALASVIRQEARTTRGPARRNKMLEDATARCRDALKIIRRETLPEEWAAVQYNLGLVLFTHGQISGDPRIRRSLLDDAIEANRKALTAYTADANPIRLARVERSLGDACELRAEAARRPRKDELLRQAIGAYAHAVGIATARLVWSATEVATIQSNLGHCYVKLARLLDPPSQADLLTEAASAFQSSARGFSGNSLLVQQAEALRDMASAMGDHARVADTTMKARLLGEAIGALDGAVRILGRAGPHTLHAEIHLRLATLRWQRLLESGSTTREEIARIRDDIEKALRGYTEAGSPVEYRQIQKLAREVERKNGELGWQ